MKITHAGKFLTLNTTLDGYEYVSENRGPESVAVLCYQDSPYGLKVLVRFERCPAHGDSDEEMYSLTGGIEDGFTARETVLKEVFEESGYDIFGKGYAIEELGVVEPSKMSDALIRCFAVNIEKISEEEMHDRHTGLGDGTPFEEGAYCMWVDMKKAMLSTDPVLHSMSLFLLDHLGLLPERLSNR